MSLKTARRWFLRAKVSSLQRRSALFHHENCSNAPIRAKSRPHPSISLLPLSRRHLARNPTRHQRQRHSRDGNLLIGPLSLHDCRLARRPFLARSHGPHGKSTSTSRMGKFCFPIPTCSSRCSKRREMATYGTNFSSVLRLSPFFTPNASFTFLRD